jgi:hypothetical protein
MMASIALLVLGLAQDPPKDPTAQWKVDAKLSFGQKDGAWVFSVAGTTNIPADVVLRARVYAVEIVDDFRVGKREDEEPLVWEDDESQPAFRKFNAADGRFAEEIYRFSRKPYALLYRVRIHYLPRDQSAEVARRMGDDDFSRAADLRVGDDAELAAQFRERLDESGKDLTELLALYHELKKAWQAHLKGFEAAAWKAFKDPWYVRVERIAERNKERFNLWAVWTERQSRMRIGGMTELLRRMLVSAGEHLEGQGDHKAHLEQMFSGWLDYFEEAVDAIGANLPLDPERAGPVHQAYRAALAPLRAVLADDAKDVETVRLKVKREGLSTLLQYPPLLQNRKRGYLFVNEVSARFTRLLGLMDAGASRDELRKALADHDRALADFESYAGLPPPK